MPSLILSTIAFFVASYFIKRYLNDELGAPPGMTRSFTVFALAIMISYGVGALVDWIAG